ncbi:hypothetical protein Q31b_01780 [Novipirellula aureliae]|uniref:Uncharacterized protein n=1 Tax=Novipirellula aureliae TaxID=2527966 RepID=A0A5C6EAK7_9BACT|nr:hypothetical protein Q31b_01780 [Novipirellula aureliae]
MWTVSFYPFLPLHFGTKGAWRVVSHLLNRGFFTVLTVNMTVKHSNALALPMILVQLVARSERH